MNSNEYRVRVEEASAFLSRRLGLTPQVGIIVGTGLGGVAARIDKTAEFSYYNIPHFPRSTVESHAGKLVAGRFGERAVVALQGRFHFYEGYSLEEVTFPVRVMASLGIRTLALSNAAGGLNPAFGTTDLMVIRDHINLMGANPLRGPNRDAWGPRFPDMSTPYDLSLCEEAEDLAREEGLRLHKGVYVAVSGPSMETPAETRFLRMIGGDAVGMSTVPEVIVARHAGLRVFAVSVIANVNTPDSMQPIHLRDVIAVAERAEPGLAALLSGLIRRLEN